MQTLKEQDWECMQQASMLANVAQAFKTDEGMSDSEDDRVTLFSSATQLSPSRQANAKTLTVMMHPFMANRWGNNGNSNRFYFLGLQHYCG